MGAPSAKAGGHVTKSVTRNAIQEVSSHHSHVWNSSESNSYCLVPSYRLLMKSLAEGHNQLG